MWCPRNAAAAAGESGDLCAPSAPQTVCVLCRCCRGRLSLPADTCSAIYALLLHTVQVRVRNETVTVARPRTPAERRKNHRLQRGTMGSCRRLGSYFLTKININVSQSSLNNSPTIVSTKYASARVLLLAYL